MVQQDFGGVVVDVCVESCKGMWFDWGEIRKLDETNEGFGQALQTALQHPRSNGTHRTKLLCPKCGLPMHQHLFESQKEINVDECYQCGGFFLDSGELKSIRDGFMSEAERKAYVGKLLAEKNAYVDAVHRLKERESRTAAIEHFTRFLRVSYYVEGK
jgi:Zn-finger nucleic acid-binding protein